MSDLEVVWTQAMETAHAKAAARPPEHRPGPVPQDVVAIWVEMHPDKTTAQIVEGTGLSPQIVGDALFRMKRSGRVTSTGGNRAWPRTPSRWRVVDR